MKCVDTTKNRKSRSTRNSSGGSGTYIPLKFESRPAKRKETSKVAKVMYAGYTPTPCMNCKKLSGIPVDKLLLDVALMKQIDGGAAKPPAAVPLCHHCEDDDATKRCSCCVKNIFYCDSCYASSHKSAKKQGHLSIPIQEHLAATPAHVAGGGGSAAAAVIKMCSTHTSHPLVIFCETCNILICGMCGSFDHAGHIYKPIQEAINVHRTRIEQLAAEVAETRKEVIDATDAIKIIRGELKGNKDAALKIVEEGCNRLQRAVKQRRDELNALVNAAYNEKDAVLNKQITALEAIDFDSEAALQLVVATLGVLA